MKIDCLILGEYQTNCYILRRSELAKDCLIIDAGLGANKLISFLKTYDLKPAGVVLTHGHIDHIAAVTALCEHYPEMKVYIHRLDAEMLKQPEQNLSALAGETFSAELAVLLVQDKSIIEEAGVKLEVLHTPGHTQGGICLYVNDDGAVFTDDSLFAESIGRTDFPGGSMSRLLKSINEKLLTLPDETIVYPGHGPVTTIGHEKMHNEFLQ